MPDEALDDATGSRRRMSRLLGFVNQFEKRLILYDSIEKRKSASERRPCSRRIGLVQTIASFGGFFWTKTRGLGAAWARREPAGHDAQPADVLATRHEHHPRFLHTRHVAAWSGKFEQ